MEICENLKLTTNMRVALQNDISPNFCQFKEVILKVFPNIDANYKNHACLSKRTIIAAKNKDVDDLNTKIQSQINGQIYSFKSIDSITDPNEVNYANESLNSLDLPGLPPQSLQLKIGSVIIMIRNLNQRKLCNEIRLSVEKKRKN